MFDEELSKPIILIIDFEDGRIHTNIFGFRSILYAVRDEFDYLE